MLDVFLPLHSWLQGYEEKNRTNHQDSVNRGHKWLNITRSCIQIIIDVQTDSLSGPLRSFNRPNDYIQLQHGTCS